MNAAEPNAKCNHVLTAYGVGRASIAAKLIENAGNISTKKRAVCRINANKAKIPWRLRFFLLFMPLTSGSPKTSKNKITTEKVRIKVPARSGGIIVNYAPLRETGQGNF
jgi:hypothetical protein